MLAPLSLIELAAQSCLGRIKQYIPSNNIACLVVRKPYTNSPLTESSN